MLQQLNNIPDYYYDFTTENSNHLGLNKIYLN